VRAKLCKESFEKLTAIKVFLGSVAMLAKEFYFSWRRTSKVMW
jgi:hypothetical protein